MDKKSWRRKLKDNWSKENFLPQNNYFKNILQIKKLFPVPLFVKQKLYSQVLMLIFSLKTLCKAYQIYIINTEKKLSTQYPE